VGVRCSHSDGTTSSGFGIRLSGDATGMLEVRSFWVANSSWGTVCALGFSATTAQQFCSLAGYSAGSGIYYTDAGGSASISLRNVVCPQGTTTLSQCSYVTDTSSCTHAMDVGLLCSAAASTLSTAAPATSTLLVAPRSNVLSNGGVIAGIVVGGVALAGGMVLAFLCCRPGSSGAGARPTVGVIMSPPRRFATSVIMSSPAPVPVMFVDDEAGEFVDDETMNRAPDFRPRWASLPPGLAHPGQFLPPEGTAAGPGFRPPLYFSSIERGVAPRFP